jgi:hypothetical protein
MCCDLSLLLGDLISTAGAIAMSDMPDMSVPKLYTPERF